MQYYQHLLIIAAVMAVVWCLFIYFWPRMLLSLYKRAILVKGFGEGPIPLNTLYTTPQKLFTEAVTLSESSSVAGGMNRDTLLTLGWLDLNKGPLVLHVPDMADRYYSVQFTDPSRNINFAYVGKRATGTKAGEYLLTGRGWKGVVPPGMKQIASPNNSVLVIGRVFVENDHDLPAAYDLSKQIQLTPLNKE